MKRWSALATHVMEVFRPSWGHIALPAHWAKRARANQETRYRVTVALLLATRPCWQHGSISIRNRNGGRDRVRG